jgi:hypothetical protein
LHAHGGPCEGATADDAVAALTAAEQVSVAIPAMLPGESGARADVSADLAPSYRHRPGG